jgi:thioredoxin 1
MNPTRRHFTGLLVMLLSVGAIAAEKPFSQKLFDEARAAGNPVVIHVHAVWCGTCKRQAGIVAPMLATPEFTDLILFRADFDTEKALLKTLNISNKSTFVVFKGNTEVGRSTGDTNKDRIAVLFRKAL